MHLALDPSRSIDVALTVALAGIAVALVVAGMVGSQMLTRLRGRRLRTRFPHALVFHAAKDERSLTTLVDFSTVAGADTSTGGLRHISSSFTVVVGASKLSIIGGWFTEELFAEIPLAAILVAEPVRTPSRPIGGRGIALLVAGRPDHAVELPVAGRGPAALWAPREAEVAAIADELTRRAEACRAGVVAPE